MLLIGGVGYTFLGDLSFGPVVIERLQAMEWSSSVVIEDVSYNPMTVMDWLRDDPGRFDRAILLTAVARGRAPGTLHRATWTAESLSADRVQAHVAEAVT